MQKQFALSILLFLLISCSKEKRSDNAGEKMQEFVIDISNYAKGLKSNFLVIPQNGAELAFNYLDPSDGTNTDYLSAIDGVGIEELFYNGTAIQTDERLAMLQELKSSKQVMVAEFVSDNALIANAIQKNTDEGFISFPRSSTNYDYKEIPDTIANANSNDILSLQDAQNYLYLISTDNFTSRSDMVNAISSTNFDVVIIDLFFNNDCFSPDEINQLKTKQNGGKRLVIAYMNIGSAENYRYYWNNKWKKGNPSWLKKEYEGYEDEIWVKYWKKDWQEIIYGNDNSYTKKVVDAGFDGVYLDNVEAYYFLYFD